MSFREFETLFEESIYQFERSSTPQVIEKLTSSVFANVTRMMSDADKKLFSILLSVEVIFSFVNYNNTFKRKNNSKSINQLIN